MKIPYSQLRFQQNDRYVWGINFKRVIARKNENDYLVFQPKNGNGFVSRFPDLVGIENVSPRRRIEIVPYVTSKASYTNPSAGDPFHDGSAYDPGFGELHQDSFSASFRVNWTFTPKLSLQFYGQPLISAGDYSDFKELAQPGTCDFYSRKSSLILTETPGCRTLG